MHSAGTPPSLDARSLSHGERRSGNGRQIRVAGEELVSDIPLDAAEVDRYPSRIMARYPAIIEVYAQTDIGQDARAHRLAVAGRAAQAVDIEHQVRGRLGKRVGQESDGGERAIRQLVAAGRKRIPQESELP